MKRLSILFLAGILFYSCTTPVQEISVFSISYEFKNSAMDWTGDFADYPEEDSLFYELVFKHDTLPGNLNNSEGTIKSLILSGHNYSDDLFMFLKRKVTGLKPSTTYELLFNVRFASNAPIGALGVGGAPGESVHVKAGATLIEPRKVLDDNLYYRMNIDKGNQGTEGTDMINIGNVGVTPTTTAYTSVVRNNSSSRPFLLTTDATGEIWIIIGTDSGFEGTTTLFYTNVDILFNEVQ
jgi:hypothetical protein